MIARQQRRLDIIPSLGLYAIRPVQSGASARGVLMMGSDAVHAGLAKRTLGARAAPGLRPPALRPAARSSLMVSATHRKMDQPPKARPGTVMTPRWSAAGRWPLRSQGETAHRKVRPIRAPRGAPAPRRVRGRKRTTAGRPGPSRTGPMNLARILEKRDDYRRLNFALRGQR